MNFHSRKTKNQASNQGTTPTARSSSLSAFANVGNQNLEDKLTNDPSSLSSDMVIELQRTIGNKAVMRLIQRDTKPTIDTDANTEPSIQRKPMSDADYSLLLKGAALGAYNTFVYHATKQDSVNGDKGINKTGLDPNFGGTASSSNDAEMVAESKGKVHFTHSERHADRYKKLLETGKSDEHTYDNPGKAEMLQIALPQHLVDQEKDDNHDRGANTLDTLIPAHNIKRMDIPPKTLAEAQEFVARSNIANEALYSNMPREAQQLVDQLSEGDQEKWNTLMQMLKQAVMSNTPDKLLSGKPLNDNIHHFSNQINGADNSVSASGKKLPPQ